MLLNKNIYKYKNLLNYYITNKCVTLNILYLSSLVTCNLSYCIFLLHLIYLR